MRAHVLDGAASHATRRIRPQNHGGTKRVEFRRRPFARELEYVVVYVYATEPVLFQNSAEADLQAAWASQRLRARTR